MVQQIPGYPRAWKYNTSNQQHCPRVMALTSALSRDASQDARKRWKKQHRLFSMSYFQNLQLHNFGSVSTGCNYSPESQSGWGWEGPWSSSSPCCGWDTFPSPAHTGMCSSSHRDPDTTSGEQNSLKNPSGMRAVPRVKDYRSPCPALLSFLPAASYSLD